MLSGFFDGGAAQKSHGPLFAGVSGYLFNDAGLRKFQTNYEAIRNEFKRDFAFDIGILHATDCCGIVGYADFEGRMPELRWRLCREVCTLAGSTHSAAFVSAVSQEDYKRTNDAVKRRTGGLYPSTLISCLEMVGAFANAVNENVSYWLEKGDANEAIADIILRRIANDENLSRRFAYHSHAFIQKDHPNGLPLVAADMLGWEYQQNFSVLLEAAKADVEHDDKRLTSNFKLLRGDHAGRWFERHTEGAGFDAQALTNVILGIN